ncbi:MAG TPA: radical SAM family heme chaperone HemW [Bacillota bacterium]|nr:radical SAM family heme chaperone HemW [Bacillota bacterium]
MSGWGLYVHIPFCPYKCDYCDFVAVTAGPRTRQWIPRYMAALVREMENERWDGPAATAFYGGGTPTVVPLAELHEQFKRQLAPDAEVTAEANPGTVTVDSLRAMRKAGINRLSIGLQSSQDRILQGLHRLHTFQDFLDAYRAAREAGFDNLNVDLMYGLPGQSLADWRETLAQVCDLGPEHLSAYGLQVEEGTVLFARRPSLPTDDDQAEMYEVARRDLADAGYEQYEISNWCRPARACAHNLLYWRNEQWLGLGVGAASQGGSRRWTNASRLAPYCEAVEAGQPAPVRDAEPRDIASDVLVLGLRLREGVPAAAIDMDRFGPAIDAHVARGWLQWRQGRLRLTDAGLPVANQVWSDLL